MGFRILLVLSAPVGLFEARFEPIGRKNLFYKNGSENNWTLKRFRDTTFLALTSSGARIVLFLWVFKLVFGKPLEDCAKPYVNIDQESFAWVCDKRLEYCILLSKAVIMHQKTDRRTLINRHFTGLIETACDNVSNCEISSLSGMHSRHWYGCTSRDPCIYAWRKRRCSHLMRFYIPTKSETSFDILHLSFSKEVIFKIRFWSSKALSTYRCKGKSAHIDTYFSR